MSQQISITGAFSQAWERMKTSLFRPFDLGKWMALGFTAWLAGLTGGGGNNVSWNIGDSDVDSDDLERAADGIGSVLEIGTWQRWWEWLLDHPWWLAAGVGGCAFLVTLALALFWLSSRGKFMFLDNVVHDRAQVVAPWKRYRRLANSHFFFRLAFFAVLMVLVLGVALTAIGVASQGGWETDLDVGISCLIAAGVVLVFLPVVLTIAYIEYFLDGFVVPLMHRYDLRVMDAWSRFGQIFRRRPWPFLLSGLFLFVLAIAVGISIVIVGLLTCCVGFLVLLIPYIGTVLVLPVPVTYRAFTVALLDQMDPGYFPVEATDAPEPPTPTPQAPPTPPAPSDGTVP